MAVVNIVGVFMLLLVFTLLVVSFSSVQGVFGNSLKMGFLSLFGSVPVFNFTVLLSFWVVLFFAFTGFLPWGFAFLLSPLFVLFISLVFYLSSFFFLGSSFRFSFHLVDAGDSFFKAVALLLIHISGELIKPLSLTLRLFINLLFGFFMVKGVHFLFYSFSLGVFLYSGGVFFLIFETAVLLIQSFIFSYIVKVYMGS